MRYKLDRIMYEISVIYIALPVFLFLAGWLRLIVAIPVCTIFLFSLFLLLKNRPEPIGWHLSPKQWSIVLISFLILALWVFLSGQGGFSFQNSDYNTRNAIFRDLIEKSWPVVYDYSNQNGLNGASIAGTSNAAVLTYYIAFWLPGAIVGKLFGWYAANVFLYFWTLLGVVMIAYFLFRTLRRASIRSIVILVFFSGLDILGYMLLSNGNIPDMTAHIEWWSGLQYSSNTTLVFWVFNQTISIWLAILLIMNLKNTRSLFFLYAMLLLHGPFPFLGMLPIVLWKAYQGYPLELALRQESDLTANDKTANIVSLLIRWFWSGVRRALTFENLAGGISVILIVYLYLANNISSTSSGTNAISLNYYIFIVFECGLYLVFLFVDHSRRPLYWICVGSLLVIPFFRIGSSQDFCMRVSIPALFVVQILIQQTLLRKEMPDKAQQKAQDVLIGEEKQKAQTAILGEEKSEVCNETEVGHETEVRHETRYEGKRLVQVILVILLMIGSVVPIEEISRSIVYTLPAYQVTKAGMISLGDALKNSDNNILAAAGNSLLAQSQYGITWTDSLKTLGNDKANSSNFIGLVEDNFFYEYLARK